jgi:molybdopterin synthase catalytic subunit
MMATHISVSVQEADFDVGIEIAALSAGRDDVGAVASFVGLVRADKLENIKLVNVKVDAQDTVDTVHAMTLEHYPGMTEKSLEAIVAEAATRWSFFGARVIHRVGRLLPGERIVFVAVASAHRGDAFAACEFIMDYLKTRAPFWKKEDTPAGGRWVDARDSDDSAAARWEE